jgi:adenylate cyclase
MKRISPVVVVGLALTIVCLVLYVSGPTFIQAISNYLYDALIRRASSEQPQKANRIVILDIDEYSLNREGQWPWPRYLVSKLTENVLADGASVIAFDVVFAEKDRTSPSIMKETMSKFFPDDDISLEGIPKHLLDFDEMFAHTLTNGNTILGSFMMSRAKEGELRSVEEIDPHYNSSVMLRYRSLTESNANSMLMTARDMTISIPRLNKMSRTAFFNADPDPDNIVRSNPLVYSLQGKRIYPSLALEAVRLDAGGSQAQVLFDEGEQGIEAVRVRDLLIPTDKAGRIVVNYRDVHRNERTGFFSSFPTVSASDVLTNGFEKGTFSNKIVFVGTSAVGLNDMKATPICGDFPGVEVHATMVDNILSGDILSHPWWMVGVHIFAILAMGIFLTIFISKGQSWLSFLVSILMIVFVLWLSLKMMRDYQLVFVPAWLIASVIIIYPILTMLKFWQEEMQKRKVRGMFGTMVSEDVLHYLENNPGSFSLTGQEADATMFFSDVANFTTISESLKADQVAPLLNRYLSPMTDIIMGRGGYVDKYEGDAIMAEWGVPYSMEDHAVQACLSAIEQQQKLAEIRPVLLKDYGHEIHVRMGINSGTVIAGNMGSDKKFQYTVMGDAVNQAARFEPANKDYKTQIIIGQTTYERAKDAVETRLLDKLIVVGKTQPVLIYELLTAKGKMKTKQATVVGLYEEALKLHWERKWDEATKALEDILELDPDDIPSAMLLNRVVEYRANPPPDEWAGEYARTTKD